MNQNDIPDFTNATGFVEQGERALAAGLSIEALEIVTEGLKRWPDNEELQRIQGRAWTGCGVPEQANRIFSQLYEKGDRHSETLGNLARTHKDFGFAASDPEERERHLHMSMDYYAMAYAQRAGDYWTGINVATLATILGEIERAAQVTRAVLNECQRQWNDGGGNHGDRYWLAATLGEAELILGNWSEAEHWYRTAANESGRRYLDLSRTRSQARLLLRHLGKDSAWIDALLRVPKVAVFVGHMCDQDNRPRPRFPAQLEQPVRNAIRNHLKKHNALIGFSSAACGSDILFLETLLELDGEPHVVLPYEKELFARESVDIVPGWRSRYDTLMEKLALADKKRSRVTEVARGKMELESASYDYANLVLHGFAVQRAKELDSELVYLAVWDRQPGDGPGGTASVVERWDKMGLAFERINLTDMLREECPQLVVADVPSASAERAIPTAPSPETRVLALLFADAVGFSKLSESQAVKFTKHCLGAICKALLDWQGEEAIVRESRGDGVYLAFERVREAGLFALHLQDLMKKDWTAEGLPADLKLRIGLHAGPVCRCFDPILGAQTWTGAHVSHAARIEPKAAHGQVYASQQFAALAALDCVTEFSCAYVGTEKLPKDYGTFPLYVVRRRLQQRS